MKKVILCLISICIVLTVSGCFSQYNKYNYEVTKGDFILYLQTPYVDGKYMVNEQYYCVVGLSEQGKQKSIITIPKQIDGINVKALGRETLTFPDGEITSSNLEIIYLEQHMGIVKHDLFYGCPKLQKVICLEFEDKREEIKSISYRGLFEKTPHGEYHLRRIPIYCYSENDYVCFDSSEAYTYGNVIYYIDTDTPFYIDFYINSIIEDLPPEPTREGYKFIGWCKDAECTEEWDFENDKLGDFEYEYNEYGGKYEYYYITKLYAKWEKIGG